MRHMNPNLMSAPGKDAQMNQGKALPGISIERLVPGMGRPDASCRMARFAEGSHSRFYCWMTAEWNRDIPALFFWNAGNQGEVILFKAVFGKHLGERQAGFFIARYQKQPGRILVQAMDNAWSFSVKMRDIGKMVEKPVDKRAVRTAGARMYGQTRRLAYHYQIGVLIQYGEIPAFRLGTGVPDMRKKGDFPGRPYPFTRIAAYLPVQPHIASQDGRLYLFS